MRLLSLLVIAMAVPATLHAAPPEGTRAREQELIRILHLKPLARESGLLAQIGRSAQTITVDGRKLAMQSQVFYMLTSDRPVDYLHWLASDDTHILIEGGPVDYFIFHPDGRVEKITLGRNMAAGEQLLIAVPAGCWKALRLRKGANYALMANVLTPEFTPDRVRIGEGQAWLTRFAGSAPWATAQNLRALIGPNWIR